MRQKLTTAQKQAAYERKKARQKSTYHKLKEQEMSQSTEITVVDVVESARQKTEQIFDRTWAEISHKLGIGKEEVFLLSQMGMLPPVVDEILSKTVSIHAKLDKVMLLSCNTVPQPLLLEAKAKVDSAATTLT